MSSRTEIVTVKHVVALRYAGPYSIIIATVDPKAPKGAPIPKAAEHMLPTKQIDGSSEVKKPGDRGDLVIPRWLADDRNLTHDGDEE